MNKENPKKNKKSFEYYIAQRKEEFRCQYDHGKTCNISFKKERITVSVYIVLQLRQLFFFLF